MKRFLLVGLLLFGVGQVSSFAQTDDIYFNSADIERQKKEDKNRRQNEESNNEDRPYYSDNYSGEDGYQSYGRSYDNDGYSDFDNDYYYASRINRFYHPFYNRGYWSTFYNPFWYDPFWCDPYWGWSPWNRPGFSISFGYGPYWNSYWGWYNWYGYPAYGSYWNYPYYGGIYGNPYYSGYWNGYYAGLYNSGVGVRTVNYGPRHSTNAANNNSVRRALYNTGGSTGGSTVAPRARMASPETTPANRTVRPAATSDERPSGAADRAVDMNAGERPARRVFSRDDDEPVRYNNSTAPSREKRENNGLNERVRPIDRNNDAQRQESIRQRQMEQQRYERVQPQRSQEPRQQQRIEQPRMEQRLQPRMESPRMSSPAPAPSPSQRNSGGFGGRRR